MTAYEIGPLSAIDQRFQIPLNGVTYQLTIKWCAPAAAWTLDIADEGGTALISGIPIVTGIDLLEQYQHLGIAGQIVAQTDGDTFAVPTQTNLGTAGRLYFIATDGTASTAATTTATSSAPVTPGFNGLNALSALAPDAGVLIVGTGATWITAKQAVTPPQGRLTLTSATPVLISSVSGATTIYYTPYVGQHCPVWNGSAFAMVDLGGQLSQAHSDATKSPAAASASHNYDMFVWLDGVTPRCTRGPAWTSDAARGTGAGTTELVRTNGLLVNTNAITNGPAALHGTYVGSIRVSVSGSTDFIFGSAAAGGGFSALKVWNAYNRVDVVTAVIDTSTAYTYTTAAWRAANAASVYISVMSGLIEDTASLCYRTRVGSIDNTTFGYPAIGIGVDFTSSPSDYPSCTFNGSGDLQAPLITDLSAGVIGHVNFLALEHGGTKTAFAPLGGAFSMRFRM